MDGVEWSRKKWNLVERIWLYVNEKLGAWFGNHLIADHPEIKKRLVRFAPEDKITVIPYSADMVDLADVDHLVPFGLEKNNYVILVARPEPENSILEVVRAYCRIPRGVPLVVLGEYTSYSSRYQKQVLEAGSDEVVFFGAIYDRSIVKSLRYFARFYIHGHTVGGTNPSLVEALGSGSAVLAHDNKFNRWVAGEGALYFSTEEVCAGKIELLLRDNNLIAQLREQSRCQFANNFTWDKVYPAYEKILLGKLCQ
jgi:glycosyltransferase involved in cell wall biosynthesis